jgi:acyl-CoA oxidase
MRHEVIGLTDGFGLPDFVLKAPIAKYDGDIYQSKKFFIACCNTRSSNSISKLQATLKLFYKLLVALELLLITPSISSL